jgi:actin-like ATPase involved in cell morphogenesis
MAYRLSEAVVVEAVLEMQVPEVMLSVPRAVPVDLSAVERVEIRELVDRTGHLLVVEEVMALLAVVGMDLLVRLN